MLPSRVDKTQKPKLEWACAVNACTFGQTRNGAMQQDGYGLAWGVASEDLMNSVSPKLYPKVPYCRVGNGLR